MPTDPDPSVPRSSSHGRGAAVQAVRAKIEAAAQTLDQALEASRAGPGGVAAQGPGGRPEVVGDGKIVAPQA